MGESLGSLHAHVCTYRTPTRMCPSSSVSSESPVPDLRLGKQLLWEHCYSPPAPSWAGKREPPKNATGSAYVHDQSWGSDGAGLCCLVPQAGLGCPPLLSRAPRPPPVLSLFSGPEPGATSKCRLDFLRAPGAALSLLFPGYCLSPSMYPPCWGAVGFVALTTV